MATKKAKKPKYILLLQRTDGNPPSVSFEITENKFQKVIQLLQPEIKKRIEKAEKCTSVSLLDFF